MGRKFLQLTVTVSTLFGGMGTPFDGLPATADAQEDGGILLPPPPQPTRPPGEDRFAPEPRDNRRRRDRRKKPDKPLPSPAERRRKALAEEAQKPRPQKFALEISLVLPDILVTTNRERYTADVTSHFNFFWRPGEGPNRGDVGIWYGGRLAAFSGSGIYSDVPGRYGFLYFGPMVGVGKIDPPQQSFRRGPAGEEPQLEFGNQQGWLITTGVAIQSRSGVIDPSDEEVEEDFDSESVAFDAPGLWGEARYMFVHYGALHSSYFAGFHTGAGKIFGYVGLGIGGWY